VAELARRKADGRGLTTPELAVVIANVKNRYKRILSALPLTDNSWAESVLKPYFPDLLVATAPRWRTRWPTPSWRPCWPMNRSTAAVR
jgi:glutamate dehydrogenase